MQERLQSLQILEEMAEMKTTEKVQMLKLQGKPAHVQAVLKLQQEVSKRSAAVKLSRLSASLEALSGQPKQSCRNGGAESV